MRLGEYSKENHNESQQVGKYDILESYHSWSLVLLPTQSLYHLPTHSHSATTLLPVVCLLTHSCLPKQIPSQLIYQWTFDCFGTSMNMSIREGEISLWETGLGGHICIHLYVPLYTSVCISAWVSGWEFNLCASMCIYKCVSLCVRRSACVSLLWAYLWVTWVWGGHECRAGFLWSP